MDGRGFAQKHCTASQVHTRSTSLCGIRNACQARLRGHARSRPRSRHNCVSTCIAGKQWETGCKLVGCGSSAPEAVLSNKDLETLVETNDDWIATRTGIRKRHILGENETLSDHAARSAQQALDMAGISAIDVDLIILATSSPDDLFGSACRVSTSTSKCLVDSHCVFCKALPKVSAGANADRGQECYSI